MRTYTFKIRKGVKFSDGTDLNATAVKWNLDNAVATKGAETAAISSVEVIDDYTVRVNLTKWSSLFLGALTQGIWALFHRLLFKKTAKTRLILIQ
jgi:peptide/nickel transport system substrate-binding protein